MRKQSDIVISSHVKFFYILGGKSVFESGFKENNKKSSFEPQLNKKNLNSGLAVYDPKGHKPP